MSREYDFAERLAFSRGIAETTHPDTIIKLIPGCVDVQRTSKTEDRRGIDFKAILRRGAELNIDIKSREKGCSKFWQPYRFGQGIEPELALEKYSVAPPSAIENPIVEEPKTGWTLDESKETDYTLHVFDPSDTIEVFLLPFQLLRIAFRKHIDSWYANFKHARQFTHSSFGSWESECIFVPGWCVIEAVSAEMRPKTPASPVESLGSLSGRAQR